MMQLFIHCRFVASKITFTDVINGPSGSCTAMANKKQVKKKKSNKNAHHSRTG